MTGYTELLKSAAALNALGVETPDYARTLNIPAGLSDAGFACADKNFPIGSKSATYHAYAHALVVGASSKVASTILDAGKAWGIEADLAKAADAVSAEHAKQASAGAPAEDPLAHLNSHALPSRGLFPIHSGPALEESARKIASSLTKMTAGEVFEACNNLRNNAAHFKIASQYLPADLHELGEYRLPHMRTVDLEIEARLKKSSGEFHETYRTIAKAAADIALDGRESIELADVLLETDKAAGLSSLWFKDLMHPNAVIMSGDTPEEINKIASHLVLLAGVPVPVAAVASIPESILNAEFSKASKLVVAAIIANDGLTEGLRECEQLLPEADQKRIAKLAALHS